jgi:hypothetical protein
MRHADINLTMKTYAHVLMEQKTKAIDTLPGLSIPDDGTKRKKKRA